jgi:serine/threonine-protein kinase
MEMTTNGFTKQYPIEKTLYQCHANKRAFHRVKLPQLGLYYGLKEIEASDARAAKAIKNEIIALNRLPFGIAAKCHQYWQEGNKHYLLMDWIDGMPLNEFISSEPKSRRELAQGLKVAEKVGWKLVELHRYHVTHRDLKPENVIVHSDKNGNVRDVSLIDFGLSNQKRQLEEGTAHYRSPEQEFVRNASLTHSSDVFSFSQLIHFLVTGSPVLLQPNFQGTDWDEVVLAMPDFTPAKLNDTLSQGLQFDSRKRTKQVFSMVKALQEASKKLNNRG